VQNYHFYRKSPDEGRAVVVYSGPVACVRHHDIIMSWPGMAAPHDSADLAVVDLSGPMTAAMQHLVDRMGLGSKVRHQGAALAGFDRNTHWNLSYAREKRQKGSSIVVVY